MQRLTDRNTQEVKIDYLHKTKSQYANAVFGIKPKEFVNAVLRARACVCLCVCLCACVPVRMCLLLRRCGTFQAVEVRSIQCLKHTLPFSRLPSNPIKTAIRLDYLQTASFDFLKLFNTFVLFCVWTIWHRKYISFWSSKCYSSAVLLTREVQVGTHYLYTLLKTMTFCCSYFCHLQKNLCLRSQWITCQSVQEFEPPVA